MGPTLGARIQDAHAVTPECLREVLSQCLSAVEMIERRVKTIDDNLFGAKPESPETCAKATAEPSLEISALALRERLRRLQDFLAMISDKI